MKKKLRRLLHIKPVFALYKALKKFKRFLRKALTGFKALLFFIKWSIADKQKIYKKLKQNYGMSRMKPFQALHWKHKTCYVTGYIQDEEYFVKIGGLVDTTEREMIALNTCKNNSVFLAEHIPTLAVSEGSDADYLVEKMLKGESLDKIKNVNEEEVSNIVNQIYRIYLELKQLGVRHLDIRPANFIYNSEEKKVYLIDFGFATVNSDDVFIHVKKDKNTIAILKNLGSKFAMGKYCWDDAYSFLLTIKTVDGSVMSTHPDIWKELNLDTGIRTLRYEEAV